MQFRELPITPGASAASNRTKIDFVGEVWLQRSKWEKAKLRLKISNKEREMLAPNYDHKIPELTVEVARAAFPKGNKVMKIRDELGTMFADDEFATLYPAIGQPGVSPARLALVTILQFMENLTDRAAADAVRSRTQSPSHPVMNVLGHDECTGS